MASVDRQNERPMPLNRQARANGVIAASDIKFLYRRIRDYTTSCNLPDRVISQDVDNSGQGEYRNCIKSGEYPILTGSAQIKEVEAEVRHLQLANVDR